MKPVEAWSEVGERIRAARSGFGLTQTELARRIGIDRTALVRVETGERGISALELGRLAVALDIPIAHFVTRSPGPVAAYRAAAVDTQSGSFDLSAERTRFILDVELETHARDAEWMHGQGLIEPAAVPAGPKIASRQDAVALARAARRTLGNRSEPLGSMATVGEHFGLFIKVVPKSTTGASLQMEPGLGVAVVGGESDPGRRRATAAHELGHHLFGDTYNSDAGVATSDRERERLVDAFVAELLLPRDVLHELRPDSDPSDLRSDLIALSGRYRLSWTATIAAAQDLGLVDANGARRLTAALPGRGDFMATLGYEPGHDLPPGATGPKWRRAVLTAWRSRLITAERTLDLLNNSLDRDELPEPTAVGDDE